MAAGGTLPTLRHLPVPAALTLAVQPLGFVREARRTGVAGTVLTSAYVFILACLSSGGSETSSALATANSTTSACAWFGLLLQNSSRISLLTRLTSYDDYDLLVSSKQVGLECS